MAPRVTVLIGAFDNAATLDAAIASILAQTLDDFEVLLMDDGSRDATPQVIARAVASDPRVRALPMGRNVGIARSLNAGLQAARAPFVAIQDADDRSDPARLERQLDVLAARPQAAVVGARMREAREDGTPLAARTRFQAGEVGVVLPRFNPIPNGIAMLRRGAILAVGGYDPRYRFAAEYDLWLRLAEAGHAIVTLDEVLATRVLGEANVAARHERRQVAESVLLLGRAMARRRTVAGARGLVRVLASAATPVSVKRARRRARGQR